MLRVAFTMAVVWLAVLAAVVLGVAIKRRRVLDRTLALDLFALLLIGMLAALAAARHAAYYLDPAMVVALLSFLQTVAVARYHADGRLF